MFVGIPPRQRPRIVWATPLIFAALWLAYVIAALSAPAGRTAAILDWGVLTGGLGTLADWREAFADGSVLRLFTGLFLHADWIHLLGNLIFLLIFGLAAERSMGGRRFLVLFLLGGALANLAAVLAIGGPDGVVIGASGAV